MLEQRTKYRSPLLARYASDEMLYIFSEEFKFSSWRELWIALAEAEKQLGLKITQKQINELKRFKDNINFTDAEKFERQTRHDVMAHVKAYAKQCPNAAPIIHLGATSAYVGDNTDLIQLRAAAMLTAIGLVRAIKALGKFAAKYASLPALGYTHFQPAQPVTIGKRACLWIQDLLFDLKDLESFLADLKFLGVKGTTGTQASFLKLFGGNDGKVQRLDKLVTKKLGFRDTYPVTGQTYPRKVDSRMLAILSGIAQSAHKFASDIRLLQHIKEVEEPFGKNQIGSSAMAYKRNPMRSERICSIARFVMGLSDTVAFTSATQWFERTLDDSANKRMAVPEAFLGVDAILTIYENIAGGLVVNKPVIGRRLDEEVPFMATENILMEAVKRGGNRQALHEIIRIKSMEARQRMINGEKCGLLEEVSQISAFKLSLKEIERLADPKQFTGTATRQVKDFLKNAVAPATRKYRGINTHAADLKV